jgi:hypothetical protein
VITSGRALASATPTPSSARSSLRRVNSEPLRLVRPLRRRGRRAEDVDPEALAGSGDAVHVRGRRRGQLWCLRGLAAGGDVPLELPGGQHQAAQCTTGTPWRVLRCAPVRVY